MRLKWRNYGLWVSLGALITMALNDLYQIAPERTSVYIDLGLTILVAAGVISSPEKGKWFEDKDNDKGGE